ncbi:unnamed protein product [Caenorhabditis sp. 36 PRJEB53466]|nr:unnamed protein product [Caenorhabditis sp. 36 PRJEB53466]
MNAREEENGVPPVLAGVPWDIIDDTTLESVSDNEMLTQTAVFLLVHGFVKEANSRVAAPKIGLLLPDVAIEFSSNKIGVTEAKKRMKAEQQIYNEEDFAQSFAQIHDPADIVLVDCASREPSPISQPGTLPPSPAASPVRREQPLRAAAKRTAKKFLMEDQKGFPIVRAAFIPRKRYTKKDLKALAEESKICWNRMGNSKKTEHDTPEDVLEQMNSNLVLLSHHLNNLPFQPSICLFNDRPAHFHEKHSRGLIEEMGMTTRWKRCAGNNTRASCSICSDFCFSAPIAARNSTIRECDGSTAATRSATLAVLCLDCEQSEVYNNVEDLRAHIASEHLNMCPYECEKCKYAKFPTEFALVTHCQNVHGLQEMMIRYRYTPELNAKMNELANKLTRCLVSDHSVAEEEKQSELVSSTMAKMDCSDSSALFLESSSLESFQAFLDNALSQPAKGRKIKKCKKIQCALCSEVVSKERSSMVYHANTRHGKYELYECGYCQRKWQTIAKSDVVKHIKSHHEQLNENVNMDMVIDNRKTLEMEKNVHAMTSFCRLNQFINDDDCRNFRMIFLMQTISQTNYDVTTTS